MVYVNDVHSKLSHTRVRSIAKIKSTEGLCQAVNEARQSGCAISVFGGRHSLGGQPFLTDSISLDLSEFNQVIDLDLETGILRIQGGCRWPDIRAFLAKQSPSNGTEWEIHQKQTGVDSISVAGSVSINAHGNVLGSGPISSDIVRIKLVGPDGVEAYCDRQVNPELFGLVVGGMGLFGVFSEIGIQLVPKQRFLRHSSVKHALDAIKLWSEQEHSYEYGDMQLNIDPNSNGFLDLGIANQREPIGSETEISRSVTTADWAQLVALAHFDKEKAFECYKAYASQVDGHVENRADFNWDFYQENYHEALEAQFELPRGSEVLAEFFIPAGRAKQLLEDARAGARRLKIEIVLATLRAIEACEVSFLRWAKRDYICLVMAMHTEHTEESLSRTDQFCALLSETCCQNHGSFYLPYRRFASGEQLQAAYPNLEEFIRKKMQYDPNGLFGSDWFESIKRIATSKSFRLSQPIEA